MADYVLSVPIGAQIPAVCGSVYLHMLISLNLDIGPLS